MSPPAKLSYSMAIAVLLAAHPAHADWRLTPTIDLRQTYTDNVALQDERRARGQWVTELAPGLAFSHQGPRLRARGRYQYQNVFMPGGPVEGTVGSSHFLQAEATASLIRQRLLIDASAGRSQQPLSAFGPPVSHHSYAGANRADLATWRVSPYLFFKGGELRYTHDSVDTRSQAQGKTDSNSLALRLAGRSAIETLAWTADLQRQRIDEATGQETTIDYADAMLRLRIARTFALTAGVGYDRIDSDLLGGVQDGNAWRVGAAWSPGPRTRVQASTGRRFYGPSHTLTVSHRSRHLVTRLDYRDGVMATRSHFLLPETTDTAALLDDLFRPSYSDAAERRQAVDAYLQRTGLPASLAEQIHFLANRYSVQATWRASLRWRRGRSSGALSAFKLKRDPLRHRTINLPGGDTAQDHLGQHGVSIGAHHALGVQSALLATADFVRSRSRSADARAGSKLLRLAARQRLSEQLTAAVEWRHVSGSSALLGGTRYKENALALTLSARF